MSVFFVKITAPNKQIFSVASLTLEVDAPNKY